MPVENIVFAHQQAYYNVISQSTENGDFGIFIDFMLEKILKEIKANSKITRIELALKLNKTEDSIKYHLSQLSKCGMIKHIGSTKSGEWILVEKN